MKVTPIVAATGFLALLFAATAASAEPLGEWRVADGTATVRIKRCGADLCGFIATTSTAPGKDDKNPDPAKRDRSVLGIEILINMKPTGKNLWTGSTYNATDGLTYSASISLSEDDKNLSIKGCAPGGGMCGSETWTRVR
jgi:uncharacterized protein (DUF2147 family)